jgi:hypothetical protein
MMRRCYDPSNRSYKRYGGRGIKVHTTFHNKIDYINFAKSLKNASKEFEIDRINNNGDYAPNNIRWVTRKDNAQNISSVIKVMYKGNTMPAKKFAEQFVLKFQPQTVARLAKLGLTGEEILQRESKCARAGIRYSKRRT